MGSYGLKLDNYAPPQIARIGKELIRILRRRYRSTKKRGACANTKAASLAVPAARHRRRAAPAARSGARTVLPRALLLVGGRPPRARGSLPERLRLLELRHVAANALQEAQLRPLPALLRSREGHHAVRRDVGHRERVERTLRAIHGRARHHAERRQRAHLPVDLLEDVAPIIVPRETLQLSREIGLSLPELLHDSEPDHPQPVGRRIVRAPQPVGRR